jgi:hypothetical protein
MSEVTIVTSSSQHSFDDCRKQYCWEYIRRLTSIEEADYFQWGRLVHSIAELIDLGYKTKEAVIKFREKLLRQWESHKVDVPPTVMKAYDNFFITVVYCMKGYELAYGHLQDKYESQKMETKFKVPIDGGFLEGKIDKIVREVKSDEYYVWERKTASQTGESWWDASLLDSQGKNYTIGGQSLGFPIVGVIYDVYKKPNLKKGQYESDEAFAHRVGEAYISGYDKYFERKLIRFSKEDIDLQKVELTQLIKEIEFCKKTGVWRKHHPRNRIGKCKFYQLCTLGESDITLAKFYTRSEDELFKELLDEE